MRVRIAIFALLVAMNVCSFAAEIREGARMHVKENSMWFQSSSELATWQRFQQVSTSQVIKTYQDVMLGTREAWQFGNKLPVRIVTTSKARSPTPLPVWTPLTRSGSIAQ